MTAFEVQENATITLVNSSIKSTSVLLTGHNGRFSAEVNLTVSTGGVNPADNSTSSKVWIWIVVGVVCVLLVIGIVVGVKKFGGDDDEETNKETSMQKAGLIDHEEGETAIWATLCYAYIFAYICYWIISNLNLF